MAARDKKKQRSINDYTEGEVGGKRAARLSEKAVSMATGGPAEKTPAAPATSELVDMATVLKEIQTFRTEVAARTDRIENKMDLFQARFGEVDERIKTLEERVSDLEDKLTPLAKQHAEQENEIKHLKTEVDGLENQSRRNNIRVIGLPEGSEKGNPVDFFEKLIVQLLPNAKMSKYYSVVRAHRTLAMRPPPGALPRAVLIRFLHYRDRDAVLAAAREKGEIKYENVRLSIYQDLSLAVQKERKKFDQAKKMLRDKGIRYSMLFPARLRIEYGGNTQFFIHPKEACGFVERLRLDTRRVNGTEPIGEAGSQGAGTSGE